MKLKLFYHCFVRADRHSADAEAKTRTINGTTPLLLLFGAAAISQIMKDGVM